MTIDASTLAEVIIKAVVQYYSLPNSIVNDRGLLFTSKFLSSLCYLLGIKQKLSITFQPQIDGQTKRQNSTMEAYLRAFVNFKQDDWVRLLPIAEFAYNNAKNASTGYTPFELKYGYHLQAFYKEDVNPCSQSKSADKLATKLRELLIVCRENI